MKKVFCTTAILLGLLVASPVIAAEDEATTAATSPQRVRFDHPLIRSADFIGNTVRGSEGNEFGKVSQLLFEAETGRVRYLVVSTAGVEGMEEGEYLVPWQAVNTDPEGRTVALDMTAEQFRNAPEGLAIGPEEKAEELHRFYGVAPFWEEAPARRQPERFERGVEQKKIR